MRKFVLKALVLLVAIALLSVVIPPVSAGAEPQGKPFLAISDRLDDLESRIDDMGKWDKHGTDIAYMDGNVGIGTTAPATKLHVEGIITASGGNSNDWNTAYGWGDHSSVGYLTSYTETDPIFGVSPAGSITNGDISDWETAYGWGDHGAEGYLTSYSETDPQVGSISLNYVPKWDGSKLITSTIYDNGKVGIGTTSPDEKLEVNGKIKADELVYDSPRTHYIHVGGVAFQPVTDVAYSNNYGAGGAHINSGSGGLVAPVYLPDGAKVTELKVYFKDDSTKTMSTSLLKQFTTGAYSFMASVDSSGISGYGSKSDTTISSSTIDNTKYPYHLYAYSTSWDGDKMEIMSARITYTISEAE